MKSLFMMMVSSLIAMSCEKSADRFAIVDGKRIHILDRGTKGPMVVLGSVFIGPITSEVLSNWLVSL